VQPGDRVLLRTPVVASALTTALAVMSIGGIVVPVNPAWTADELGYATRLVDPTLSLSPADLDALAQAAVADGPGPAGEPQAEPAEDDAAAIIFTSGTTGRSKAAVLSQRNLLHFCMTTAATSVVRNLAHGIGGGTPSAPATFIAAAPLFHVSGLLGMLVNSVAWGTTLVVAPPGRWDATTHLALTEQHRVTGWSLVPTQLWRLIEHPDFDSYELGSLESIGGGGATFSPELVRATTEKLPNVRTGMRIGYGMTEASAIFTMLLPPVADHEVASVGRAVAGAEVEIRGPDGATALPEGEIGEIHGRSAGVFLGYWGDAPATEAVLDDDRWYATGDYGRIEGDRLVLESRLRDMILRGGENIYPIEIENRLVEHSSVAEAAVVGRDHRTLGQEVRAVVVAAPGAEVDPDALRAWVAETLAPYKVPAVVDVVDALPVNETGKVLKHLL
jgi:acyl-CoA synthetase (AMP-forming)/AMP-acid ligase II